MGRRDLVLRLVIRGETCGRGADLSAATKRLSLLGVAVATGAEVLAVWPGVERWALRLLLAFVALFLVLVMIGNTGGRTASDSLPERRSPDRFKAEINRARRYGRAVALVRVRTSAVAVAERLATDLDDHLRADDGHWTDGRDVLVVLPEANRSHAMQFVRRFQATLTDVRDSQVVIASFPEDGTTFGAIASTIEAAAPVETLVPGEDGAPVALINLHDADVPTVPLRLAEERARQQDDAGWDAGVGDRRGA